MIQSRIWTALPSELCTCCMNDCSWLVPHLSGLGRFRSLRKSTTLLQSFGRRTWSKLVEMVRHVWVNFCRMWAGVVCALHCIVATWLEGSGAKQWRVEQPGKGGKEYICCAKPSLNTLFGYIWMVLSPESSYPHTWKQKYACVDWNLIYVHTYMGSACVVVCVYRGLRMCRYTSEQVCMSVGVAHSFPPRSDPARRKLKAAVVRGQPGLHSI